MTETAPAFPEVPAFTPPRGARRPRQAIGLSALLLFARDILSTFSANAYQRRLSHWNMLARDIFVCNAPDLVRDAFVTKHEAFQRKTPQMRTALAPLIGDGLFVSDNAVWRERRAAVAPIVHGRRLPAFFPVMVETALEWREAWRQKARAGRPVDVLEEMGCLTAEIISRTVFGRRLGRQYTGQIIRGFARYQRHVDQLAVAEMLKLPGWVPRWQSPIATAAVRQIHGVIDTIIDRHLAGESDEEPTGADADGGGALIARLFAARDAEGRPFDRTAVRNEAIVIFMAGHETTANTLAWAWYLLSQADWARARLHEEVDRVLGGRVPTLEDMDRLVYAKAVIEETLRLYPPVPLLGREAQCPEHLDGKPVTEGSLVVVAPWLLHRNAHLWARPDDFVPERFLPGEPRPTKYQYVPFAIGPRICPGMQFGLVEATLCLALLAEAFDPALAPGVEVKPVCRLTLRPGKRLPMQLRPRAADAAARKPAAAGAASR